MFMPTPTLAICFAHIDNDIMISLMRDSNVLTTCTRTCLENYFICGDKNVFCFFKEQTNFVKQYHIDRR